MIVLPSYSAPGSGRGRTPVAITIDSAEIGLAVDLNDVRRDRPWPRRTWS